MSDRAKCMRFEIVYEDGTHYLLTGEAAEKHHRYLDHACSVAWIHRHGPIDDAPPNEWVAARIPSKEKGADDAK